MKPAAAILLCLLLSGCFTAPAIDRMTADHAAQIELAYPQETAP